MTERKIFDGKKRWCFFCKKEVDPAAFKTRTIVPHKSSINLKFCDDDCFDLYQRDRIQQVKDESLDLIDRARRHRDNFHDGSGDEEE